jgi:hypothetical protein
MVKVQERTRMRHRSTMTPASVSRAARKRRSVSDTDVVTLLELEEDGRPVRATKTTGRKMAGDPDRLAGLP